MGDGKNRKYGNLIATIGLIITILVIFAGLVAILTKSGSTDVLANETKNEVILIKDKLGIHETEIQVLKTQLAEIQKWQERVEKKFDRVLEKIEK